MNAQIIPISDDFNYRSEGLDDGYDPYGYGDFGYGYGYAQTQYKEIQDKLHEMKDAVRDITLKNEERIAASEAALIETQHNAWQMWVKAAKVKEDFMNALIAEQQELWETKVAERTKKVMDAIDECKNKLNGANDKETNNMDDKEKEIRWAITSIYNYDTQERLNKALTAARDEMNTTGGGRMESLMQTMDTVKAAWEESVIVETEALRANIEEVQQKCEGYYINLQLRHPRTTQ